MRKIRMMPAWAEVERYTLAVESGADAREAWEKTVVSPFWPSLCRFAPFDLSARKPKEIADTEALKTRLKRLEALDLRAIQKELNRAADAFPTDDEDELAVALFPADDGVLRERQNGVVGTSLYGNIMIRIDPMAADFESWIPYVFAHEYHHTVWGDYWYGAHGGELSGRFIDSLVIDGEADGFALSLYPSLRPSWIFGMDRADVESLWARVYHSLALQANVNYETYMFGSENAGIPWCAGYAVGYWLVQRYLQKTGASFVDILPVHPESLLY